MGQPSGNKLHIPDAFLARMSRLLGEEYPDFLSALRLPVLTGLRVNTLKLSPVEFNHLSPFKLTPIEWCHSGYIVQQGGNLEKTTAPGKHPFHTAGLYYLQEPSAMAAAEILAPQPGESVLDISAAPGGKATHLAALMRNTGLLVANEIHPRRVWDLAENLERCGVTNAVITNESPGNLAEYFGEFFDCVLLDAPCSGEGMFRKSEPARHEWREGLVRACASRQSAILEHAALLLKPGGRLAYTTCTFAPEENEGVISTFLDHHPEFTILELRPSPGFDAGEPGWSGLPAHHQLKMAVRIWPHHANAEGHFIALLEKHSTSMHPGQDRPMLPGLRSKIENQIGRSARQILSDFVDSSLSARMFASRLLLDGSYIYQLPENCFETRGIKVIRHGLWLGSIKGHRFIPSHSLAMSLHKENALQVVHLRPGDPRLVTYLSGASLEIPGEDGWVLMTVEGYPLGWGKRVQDTVKNLYPHGLRKLV
jgi:NOL1/NOP2/sun family putative RNA methylase